MAVFLGSLEYVLEEGPINDWFEDDDRARCSPWSASRRPSPSSGACFTATAADRRPARLLATATSRPAALFSFVMGIGLYGLTYLYPLFLARVRGYSALQIGETMFVTGLCMFLMAPDRRPAMRGSTRAS